jgi:hypothetical protein
LKKEKKDQIRDERGVRIRELREVQIDKARSKMIINQVSFIDSLHIKRARRVR